MAEKASATCPVREAQAMNKTGVALLRHIGGRPAVDPKPIAGCPAKLTTQPTSAAGRGTAPLRTSRVTMWPGGVAGRSPAHTCLLEAPAVLRGPSFLVTTNDPSRGTLVLLISSVGHANPNVRSRNQKRRINACTKEGKAPN